MRYTLDGTTPTAESPAYDEPVVLTETATVRARSFAADENVLTSPTATRSLHDPPRLASRVATLARLRGASPPLARFRKANSQGEVYRKIDPMVRVDQQTRPPAPAYLPEAGRGSSGQVDFAWQHGSPGRNIPVDNPLRGSCSDFEAVWTGYIKPKRSGNMTFHTIADDGIRLWIDGTKVVDDWSVHGPRERTGQITLDAHAPLRITVEYFERDGPATAKLLWSRPGLAKQVVPSDCLFVDEMCTQQGLKGTYRIRSIEE